MRHLSVATVVTLALLQSAGASVTTVPTMNGTTLKNALHPTGLTVKSITVRSGVSGQFGTFSDFSAGPVTIGDGIVLSSGKVNNLGPIPEASQPNYPYWSPPAQVNSQMVFSGDGATAEFNEYGADNVDNFYGGYDVAALEIVFNLDEPAQVKFDFIFGSVEFPYWTGQYTDAFLAFLDEDPAWQICFDQSGNPIQVGNSFAGWETTEDVNSAFSNPHGLIHHLTTTTEELDSGEHILWLEVGDVNDHILDSAVFISNLRTGVGDPGTEPTDDCEADLNHDDKVDAADLAILLGGWGQNTDADFDENDVVNAADLAILLGAWGTCNS